MSNSNTERKMLKAEFKMRIAEPREIMQENVHFSRDLAWFSNSHFKFSF